MHSSTYKGKRVYLRMKNGDVIVDKFLEKKGRYIIVEEHGKIVKRDIKSFSIYKNKPN